MVSTGGSFPLYTERSHSKVEAYNHGGMAGCIPTRGAAFWRGTYHVLEYIFRTTLTITSDLLLSSPFGASVFPLVLSLFPELTAVSAQLSIN
jgi:GTP:adenosylcobinamide-phosphate guanylyltransferase